MAVVFVCSIVSAVAGFAFSALAGAILFHLHTDPVRVVGVLLAASLSGVMYNVWSIRRSINWRELAPYVIGGVLSAPPGVLLLLYARSDAYLTVLGCFLLLYGIYTLIAPPLLIRHEGPLARSFVGALGGLTGALAAFPGAFVVIWCRAHNMDKQRQLAIVQPFILLMQAVVLGTLTLLRPPEHALGPDLIQFVAPAILGAYGGLALRHRLSTQQFNGFVSVILVLSGAILVARAF